MTNDSTEICEKSLRPFWTTPQYSGGFIQGLGCAFFSLLLLTQVSPDFYIRYANVLGAISVALIVAGGFRARKASL